jgi:hypothetical protein
MWHHFVCEGGTKEGEKEQEWETMEAKSPAGTLEIAE